MQPAIEGFAAEARRFRDWALGLEAGSAAADDALRRIVALYHSALALPSPMSGEDSNDIPEIDGRDEREAVRAACARLPLQYYSDVFDPLRVPAEENVTGDLADDIADIFDDVSQGLRLLDDGRAADALFTWRLSFRTHWGHHATSAIRVLHAHVTSHGSPI